MGPLLFLIYINHISANLLSNVKMFADDLKLYLLIRPVHLSYALVDISVVQRDINTLTTVAESWDLRVNADKTKLISFGAHLRDNFDLGPYSSYQVNGKPLCISPSVVDLGITVDLVTLRFHDHIRSVASKAAGLANNLLRSTLCRSPHFMVTLFISHIRPLLEFGSVVWNTGYITDLKLLESVQRRWTKRIQGLENMSYAQRLVVLDLFSVKGRLLRTDLIKCWKVFHGLSPISPTDLFTLASSAGTRGHRHKILVPYSRCDARHRFFSVRVVNGWNSLPITLAESDSLDSFKKGLTDFLGDCLFDFC